LFGETGAYLPLIAALAASVWYGGVGVGLLAQVCGATATFLFIARPQPLGSVRDVDVYGLLAFLVFGNMLSFLTANLRWNARLRQNKRDLQMIAHATHDSLWEWDLATNKIHRDGNVWRIFGGSKSENPADLDAWRRRLHPDDAGRVWDSIREVIETGRTHWEQEYRVRRCDGTYIDVSDRGMVVRDKAGKAVRMIGGVADVSAQKRAEEKLIYNASHDLLTGLPNRELFLARVRAAVAARQQRTDQVMAVLFLDIDRFKVVNDSLGHALGDQLLSAVASRLKQCLPSGTGDIAARFGGDEFTVLLDGVESISAAVRTAEQIQNLLSMPIELENHHIVITVSIGIAAARPDDAPEDVLRHADIAMYRAKAGGKARHAIFEPVIDTPAKDLLQLETDLRQSLRQQRFHLHYQPIVSLLTGQIASFEALLRWEHPRRGLLLPTDFLFIAEEAGLAVPLGQWILREAFQALARWQRSIPAARYVNMNINLSERQFLQPLIVDQIKHGLEEYGVDGRFITLELTETMMIENSELALNRIHQLRELGIKLAIDDFGKGYSSLGRLQELPVSILKIDGSFTRQIEAGKPQIVDAIIALAHQLALEVTAEGVETSWQCAHLARAGCTTGQGFFFAPALEQAAVQALLQREPLWTTTTPHAVPQVRFATNSLQ
jgi:diguanylate cyclase (GGDEF)-like protein/PAS domain S-box-containing protein